MDELLLHKDNITYSDLIVLPDDSDMDVQTDGNTEVTPPPIRYYFNSWMFYHTDPPVILIKKIVFCAPSFSIQ